MGISHTEDDYSILIKNIGGEIEKFLKAVVFIGLQDNNNFYDLINSLSSLGLPHQEIDFLHSFRQMYNSYKHNPDYSSGIIDCKTVLENTIKSIRCLNALGTGNVNQPYQQSAKRIVWLAGWDDYIGGMTEVSIFIPDFTVDFPYAIEYFNIDIKGWNLVINKFMAAGDLQMGKEFVSEKAYTAWENEDDFVGAGRFTGDITELVKEISLHINPQKESMLLPFLKRQNDNLSVKAAVVFSLFDTFKADNWNTVDDLIDEVRLRANYDYGIYIESQYLSYYLSLFNRDVLGAHRSEFAGCIDIIWTDKQGFERSRIKCEISKDLPLSFNQEGKLVTRIK